MSETPSGRRIKRGWMNLEVIRIVEDTHDTKTFIMVDKDDGGRQFDYVAGQYLTFRFDDLTEKPIARSYTMSSSPCQAEWTAFTVKRVASGLVSNWLCDHVKVGSVLRARGPIGKFVFDPSHDHQHLFMVAAGSGVTPFVSIMREYMTKLGQPQSPTTMTLLVAYRTTHDLICWPDLQAISAIPGMKVITTLTREHADPDKFWHGRPDTAMLDRLVGDGYSDKTFMTCGPQEMMDMVTAHATAHGTAAAHVKTESFF